MFPQAAARSPLLRTIGSAQAVAMGYGGVGVHSAGKTWSIQTAAQYRDYERYEVRSGDFWSGDSLNDRNRAEFTHPDRFPFNTDVWLGFWQLFEAGTPLSPDPNNPVSSFFAIGQFHAEPDVGDISTSPPLSFNVDVVTQKWQLWTRFSTPPTQVSNPGYTVRYSDEEFERGVWYYNLLRVQFHWTNGQLQFWRGRRGQPVQEVVNLPVVPVGYNDALGPYFKHGIYRHLSDDTHVVRYSGIELGLTSLASRVSSQPFLPPQ
jgi:hypothetical protein